MINEKYKIEFEPSVLNENDSRLIKEKASLRDKYAEPYQTRQSITVRVLNIIFYYV